MQFSINPWLFSGQFLDEWVSELLVVSDSFAGLTNAICIFMSIEMEDEEVMKHRLKLLLFQVLQHESQFINKIISVLFGDVL